jgi:PAS domain-containing protein
MRTPPTECSMAAASAERRPEPAPARLTVQDPGTCWPRNPFTPAMVAALVATLPIGVVLLSMDGSVVYANDAARPLWTNAHACAAPAPLDAIIARALLAGVVVRDEELAIDPVVARRDHHWICGQHLVVSATPLSRAQHEMDGLLVTLEDVTARKEMAHLRPMIESLVRL